MDNLAASFCDEADERALVLADIERTYGQRKPLAARTPLLSKADSTMSHSPVAGRSRTHSEAVSIDDDLSTSGVAEDASNDTEHESEPESAPTGSRGPNGDSVKARTMSSSSSFADADRASGAYSKTGTTTQHDLDNKYFRKDLLVFKNFDIFR